LRCASTIQIVRPQGSTAETDLQPFGFVEIVGDYFPVLHWPPRLIVKVGVSFYSHQIALGATKSTMSTSIRNRLPGTIERIVSDNVVSELTIKTAAGDITSIITTGSVKRMNLKVGDNVFAMIKATGVSIEK